jgi:hypothetical protein
VDDAVHRRLLVPNSAASARVVRLVRSWVNTSSTRTGSGRPQGRPVCGGEPQSGQSGNGVDLSEG